MKESFQEGFMKTLFAFALVLAAVPAMAQNWVGLLKNTAAERFDEEDLQLFLANSRKALAEGKDGETASWENPKTRARGDITVLRSFESKGRPCKEVRVRNQAQGRKGDNTFNLCQVDGKWRLLSSSQMKKK
jgi:surface antigen